MPALSACSINFSNCSNGLGLRLRRSSPACVYSARKSASEMETGFDMVKAPGARHSGLSWNHAALARVIEQAPGIHHRPHIAQRFEAEGFAGGFHPHGGLIE